jgi:hypothetical protein
MRNNWFQHTSWPKRVVRFAVAALVFSLTIGLANAGQPGQGNPDTYNYTRGGGG